MSFWRGDPLAEKDSRHWIGSAIALLQKMGFHRARQAKGIRKRLWWAVYIRERQIAAALGLPNRIRVEDCDIECLSNDDFVGAFRKSLAPDAVDVVINFNIGMAGIASLLGHVLQARYLLSRRNDEVHLQELREKLSQWRAKYLGTMPISVADGAACRNFYVNTLLMAYHNLRILLFRSDNPGLRDQEDDDLGGDEVIDASTAICRIVEDMLSSGTIRHCQIHVITNIFNTLCVQTLGLRTWTGEPRTLAVYRAKICLLGVRELQKTWDVTNWVLRLYFKYLDQGTAARLAMEGADEDLHLSPGEAGEQSRRQQRAQYPEANQSIRGAAQELGGHGDVQVVPGVPFPMLVEPDASLLAELGDGFVFDGNMSLGDHTWSPDLLTQLI